MLEYLGNGELAPDPDARNIDHMVRSPVSIPYTRDLFEKSLAQ